MGHSLNIAGLFAGIGGIELGLHESGHRTVLLSEIDPAAREVLAANFADSELRADIAQVEGLPEVDLVAAGFPCQDLSQAGGKKGISGEKSGLVSHIFRLLEGAQKANQLPPFVLIENVSYMLRLNRGNAMNYLVDQLEDLGYSWAYRVVDSRSFGIPQRRQRVILLASTEIDPSPLVLAEDAGDPVGVDAIGSVSPDLLYGFYWTEGKRGLGWTKSAIPTLKGGSGLGIPSPPAIWDPNSNVFGTPSLNDSERLQGFPAGWTLPADNVFPKPERFRWHQVGNAVCVPVSRWIGDRLVSMPSDPVGGSEPMVKGRPWPRAAFGVGGKRFLVDHVSTRPVQHPYMELRDFLQDPLRPLTVRAAAGFLSRAESGKLRFADGFLDSLRGYIDAACMSNAA